MHEALGVSPMSFEKDLAPGGVELVGATVVNGGRRHEPQSRVPVRVVVVVEETAAEQGGRLPDSQSGLGIQGNTSSS